MQSSDPPQPEPEQALPTFPASGHERLWTPWRMRYVAGNDRENGCIFCNRLAGHEDARSLILHRGERVFIIMNLFPYNTGHVMIVPNDHVASLEDADPDIANDMGTIRGPVLRALRRALAVEGFNLGLNVGAVAGAGVTDHLHEHVVPRWQGDANFMPILAGTTVMPELIPVTYAKLRAELARELGGDREIQSLVLTPDARNALVDAEGRLPRAIASNGEPLWRAALRDVHDRGVADAELIGWAGGIRADEAAGALLFRAALADAGALAAENRVIST
ncbi:MAG: HIT domain-containing protein, partial [Chloroflexia bacterium]|nr:HIT domain-containing protein [Chloroflexia bacterium]